MTETTLLWHDYETWGVDPRRDRASQFAAIRTNTELEIIGEPISIYCKPALDFIPSPQSALITGLTPQICDEKGTNEADFFDQILQQFSIPGTCGVGYNSLRFDDEVTRFGFYRNFHDPYAREWQNGNSRWDIIDLVRMTYALRPEGINWPEREPGIPSFRLDQLSVANDIEHVGAHDALSDVHATIGLARVIRAQQPRLFDYAFSLRNKQTAAAMLNLKQREVILHVSGMYPSSIGCIAPVMPLAQHPRNKNEYIVYDLRVDPTELIKQSAETIAETLFTPKDDLPEGIERAALKGVHINKSPALAPTSTISDEQADRWGIDWNLVKRHRLQLMLAKDLEVKIRSIYELRGQFDQQDPDAGLYQGFLDRSDRRICDQLHQKTPEQRVTWKPPFQDPRLQAIYPRYLGRNWPELLNDEQREQWQAFCQSRLLDGEYGCEFTLDDFLAALDDAESFEVQPNNAAQLLQQLQEWVETKLKLGS